MFIKVLNEIKPLRGLIRNNTHKGGVLITTPHHHLVWVVLILLLARRVCRRPQKVDFRKYTGKCKNLTSFRAIVGIYLRFISIKIPHFGLKLRDFGPKWAKYGTKWVIFHQFSPYFAQKVLFWRYFWRMKAFHFHEKCLIFVENERIYAKKCAKSLDFALISYILPWNWYKFQEICKI